MFSTRTTRRTRIFILPPRRPRPFLCRYSPTDTAVSAKKHGHDCGQTQAYPWRKTGVSKRKGVHLCMRKMYTFALIRCTPFISKDVHLLAETRRCFFMNTTMFFHRYDRISPRTQPVLADLKSASAEYEDLKSEKTKPKTIRITTDLSGLQILIFDYGGLQIRRNTAMVMKKDGCVREKRRASANNSMYMSRMLTCTCYR